MIYLDKWEAWENRNSFSPGSSFLKFLRIFLKDEKEYSHHEVGGIQ